MHMLLPGLSSSRCLVRDSHLPSAWRVYAPRIAPRHRRLCPEALRVDAPRHQCLRPQPFGALPGSPASAHQRPAPAAASLMPAAYAYAPPLLLVNDVYVRLSFGSMPAPLASYLAIQVCSAPPPGLAPPHYPLAYTEHCCPGLSRAAAVRHRTFAYPAVRRVKLFLCNFLCAIRLWHSICLNPQA